MNSCIKNLVLKTSETIRKYIENLITKFVEKLKYFSRQRDVMIKELLIITVTNLLMVSLIYIMIFFLETNEIQKEDNEQRKKIESFINDTITQEIINYEALIKDVFKGEECMNISHKISKIKKHNHLAITCINPKNKKLQETNKSRILIKRNGSPYAFLLDLFLLENEVRKYIGMEDLMIVLKYNGEEYIFSRGREELGGKKRLLNINISENISMIMWKNDKTILIKILLFKKAVQVFWLFEIILIFFSFFIKRIIIKSVLENNELLKKENVKLLENLEYIRIEKKKKENSWFSQLQYFEELYKRTKYRQYKADNVTFLEKNKYSLYQIIDRAALLFEHWIYLNDLAFINQISEKEEYFLIKFEIIEEVILSLLYKILKNMEYRGKVVIRSFKRDDFINLIIKYSSNYGDYSHVGKSNNLFFLNEEQINLIEKDNNEVIIIKNDNERLKIKIKLDLMFEKKSVFRVFNENSEENCSSIFVHNHKC